MRVRFMFPNSTIGHTLPEFLLPYEMGFRQGSAREFKLKKPTLGAERKIITKEIAK